MGNTPAFVPKPKVLLIEDEQDLLLMFTEALTNEGYEVCGCRSLPAARALLQNGGYAAVVADWNLAGEHVDPLLLDPSMEKFLPPVVIVISGFIGSEDFNHELTKKFFFLEKPFILQQLPDMLSALLKKKSP